MLNCATGKIKAFGLDGFTLFFDHDGELLRNLWMQIVVVNAQEQSRLLEALYDVGETHELLLVDWNAGLCANLTDRSQIRKYLAGFLT